MILASDVMTKVAEPFFDPARVHHMHTAQFDAQPLSRRDERFEHMCRHVRWHVNLPAQLADICHPVRPSEAHANLDLLGCAERVAVV